MAEAFASKCGIYCGTCKFREKMNCLGCQAAAGNVFWGKCRLANCSLEKGLSNCGECEDFACDLLKEFAYDKQNGDDGERIRNLQAWNAEGLQQWKKKKGLADV